VTGVNVLDLKKQNRKQILLIIKKYGPLPRIDIAKLLKLTPAAVTIISNEMLEEGIIIEKGQQVEVDKRVGRKRILIDINYNFKYIVGVSIESETLNIGLSNLKGEVVDKKQFMVSKEYFESKLDIFKLIGDSCMNLFWENNIKKQDILGMGIGIVGSVDSLEGISVDSYGVLEKKIQIKNILQEYLNIPVCVDNNVRALAMAEIEFRPNDNNENYNNNMVFVKYGPGIGAAIVINNEIYQGSSNNAGELGHTTVNYHGDICKCGRRGCLETIASQNAVIIKTKKMFSKEDTPFLYKITHGDVEDINLLFILESAHNGDVNIISILEDAAFYFAIALSTAITLYDPKEVVFYGEVFRYDFFIDKLKFYFKDILCDDNMLNIIRVSNLEYQNKFLGGVALALKKFFYNEGGKNINQTK